MLEWAGADVPEEPVGPMSIDVAYDRTELSVNDTIEVSVRVELKAGAARQAIVDLGVPPGFEVAGEDLADLIGGPGESIITGLTELSADLAAEEAARILLRHPEANAEQPGGESRIAAEGLDRAEDRQVNLLDQILHVLLGPGQTVEHPVDIVDGLLEQLMIRTLIALFTTADELAGQVGALGGSGHVRHFTAFVPG